MKGIIESLASDRQKRNRFRLFMIPKEVAFPESLRVVLPESSDFKMADKTIALLASKQGVSPGQYQDTDAKETAKVLISGLVVVVNQRVAQYSFENAIPTLLSNIDALVHEHEMNTIHVRESIDQEVNYDRESRMSKDRKKYLHDHQTHRYLIEKFVQITPGGQQDLSLADLRRLLALVERLLNLYAASDAIYYGIAPAELTISDEFIASITFVGGFEDKEHEYGREQSRISLGAIGCKEDVPEGPMPVEEHLSELDLAFREDVGFGLRHIVSVLQVLSMWANTCEVEENACYSAPLDEIKSVCSQHIQGFDSSRTRDILKLLTLRTEDVLRVDSKEGEAPDIPVWEYTKRVARYTVKPMIEVGDFYFWGPYSVSRSSELWSGIAYSHKLPVPMEAPTTKSVLQRAHIDLGESLEEKIKEIVARYTPCVRSNVYPHRLDNTIVDIGDFDVVGYFDSRGVLLSIECKIIDPAYCMKDARRVQHKIFGRQRSLGGRQDGYLQKVERRHEYLEANAANIVHKCGWGSVTKPLKVISIFVTQRSFWWTRFPTAKTEVRFVESRLLDDFIKDLVG